MSPCPNASRHNKELAANASIATVVSNATLPEIDLKFPERIAATLVWIYDACDSEENARILTSSGQPSKFTRITLLLDVLLTSISAFGHFGSVRDIRFSDEIYHPYDRY